MNKKNAELAGRTGCCLCLNMFEQWQTCSRACPAVPSGFKRQELPVRFARRLKHIERVDKWAPWIRRKRRTSCIVLHHLIIILSDGVSTIWVRESVKAFYFPVSRFGTFWYVLMMLCVWMGQWSSAHDAHHVQFEVSDLRALILRLVFVGRQLLLLSAIAYHWTYLHMIEYHWWTDCDWPQCATCAMRDAATLLRNRFRSWLISMPCTSIPSGNCRLATTGQTIPTWLRCAAVEIWVWKWN